MIHIIHVIGSLNSGGVQRLLLWLADAKPLSDYAHSVVCVSGATGTLSEEFKKKGFRVFDCPFPWPPTLNWLPYRFAKPVRQWLAISFPFRLARVVKRSGADIVHTHESARIHYQAKAIVTMSRKPWIWTLHGQYYPAGRTLQQWREALEIARSGRTCVTAVSRAVAQNFLSSTGAEPHRIMVCHSAIDLRPFARLAPLNCEYRSQFGIPKTSTVFGSVGRLVEEKAYDVLISAAATLLSHNPSTYFLVAGEGKQRKSLEKLIEEKRIQHRFHFLGNCDNVPAFLENLDVFVLSSRREGFGMALVEALAAGLPCIGTRVGGIPEILSSTGGLLAEPDNPQSLLAAMEQMLNEDARTRYKESGREIAKRFSVESCAQQYGNIYARLLRA